MEIIGERPFALVGGRYVETLGAALALRQGGGATHCIGAVGPCVKTRE